MKVLVCGSRDFTDPFRASLAIDARISELPPKTTVIHGAARGTDRIAAEAAERHGHTIQAFPADWKKHGKRAGIVRNLQMLDEAPDLVIAFWDGKSPGTKHTTDEARRRGIPVEILTA